MPSVVLAPFVGAYNLFGVGYRGRPVEALSECISDQGSGRGMVTADPTMDIAQQAHPLLNGDEVLWDPGVASLVDFTLHKKKGLDTTCEPSSFCLVHWQCVTEEVVEVEYPPVV